MSDHQDNRATASLSRRDFLTHASVTVGVVSSTGVATLFPARAGGIDEPKDGVGADGISGQLREDGRIQAAQELTTVRPRRVLDGQWEFAYDLKGVGDRDTWFAPDRPLSDVIQVPGCAQAESHGLPPPKAESRGLKWPCLAPAWFRRRFSVPADWRGGRVVLHLGGVHPAARFWLNGKLLGQTSSSRCALRCEVSGQINWDGENLLAAKLFWPDGPRMDGLWDHSSFAWTGIYRSIWIERLPDIWIDTLEIQSSISPTECTVQFSMGGAAPAERDLRALVEVRAASGSGRWETEAALAGPAPGKVVSVRLSLPGARLWGPDAPHLHFARVRLVGGSREIDAAELRFGLRDIRVSGKQVLLNGVPVYLRGGADDQSYPLTVCPPASKEFFLERLRTAMAFGFNYTKSCVEVFPREFLEAADELGMLVCQEMPFGLSGKYRALRHDPTPEWTNLFERELENIVRFDRHHPSVVIYSMASELSIPSQSELSFRTFNQKLPAMTRALNPKALVIDVTQTREFGLDTKLGRRDTDIIENAVNRTKGIRRDPFDGPLGAPSPQQCPLPLLLHEYRWWTSLPDPALASAYQATPLNFSAAPLMEANAQRNGIAADIPSWVRNSRRLKHALQKEGLETARKHPHVAGYHFWLIHDFNWCPEGILDEFWRPPPEVSAEQFRMSNGDTVLLLDDGDRRSFACGHSPEFGLRVSHFGKSPLSEPVLLWELTGPNGRCGHGSEKVQPVACGDLARLLTCRPRLPDLEEPARLTFRAILSDRGTTVCENQWSLWVYPQAKVHPWAAHVATELPFLRHAHPELPAATIASPPAIIVTARLGKRELDAMETGARVVLLSRGSLREYRRDGDRDWANTNTYRTIEYLQGAHGNMGTAIRAHSALGRFPHDGWCDLNFVPLVSGVYPIDLEPFGTGRIGPIIRSVDHYKTMADKAYLFEVGVGRGALLATSLRIAETYETDPATRYLLGSMLQYATGTEFRPATAVTRAQLESAISPQDQ